MSRLRASRAISRGGYRTTPRAAIEAGEKHQVLLGVNRLREDIYTDGPS